MDAGKSPAARALLLDTGATGWLAEHPALSNENNVAV